MLTNRSRNKGSIKLKGVGLMFINIKKRSCIVRSMFVSDEISIIELSL